MNRPNLQTRKPAGLALLFAAGILGLMAQPAAAHKIDYRPPLGHHYYYQYGRPFVFPRWLRKDYDFQRWYLRSDYRFIRGASWRRLYDMYIYDTRYRRHRHRHHHHRHVIVDFADRPRRRR